MGITKQRTPAAQFDDIPGDLPVATIPDDVNLQAIGKDAIEKLRTLNEDDFADDAVWRDFLSFTGTYRTFNSAKAVCAVLEELCKSTNPFDFEHQSGKERVSKHGESNWADVDFTFKVHHGDLVGECAGTVSVILTKDGQWKLWMLRTWLESFLGHGHPDIPVFENGHTNGATNGVHREEPEVYGAVVVGGSQAGLSLAGRLKALDVTYVMLEKNKEIGEAWSSRYETLKWHTSKESGNLPFDRTFTPEDEYCVPIKVIGEAHNRWARKYGINARCSTTVDAADYDHATKLWTIQISSPEGTQSLTARNLVLALGGGSATPISPEWASEANIKKSGFKGTIMHSKYYKSAQPWRGRKGIVVGTANTGHDVADAMANVGIDCTMVQRGATFIFPAEWLWFAEDRSYNTNVPTAEADRMEFTYPNKIMRQFTNRAVFNLIRNNAERFDALEKAGFKVDRFGDIYNNLFVRFGGHYVDIGTSKRIADGEIKVVNKAVTALGEKGLTFDDGSQAEADLIVLCTGFDHDFRADAARIVGKDVADQMDDYFAVDIEGEIRGLAKLAGHPALYYHGGDVRMARFYSRFIALSIQADVLGQPLALYTKTP